jgi:predicted nucleotidyltransferase component of viral defense system
MIKTAKQLKDKTHNLSGGNSNKAQTLIRNYMMERFLERVTLSKYRNNFILKGGMLVAAMVGLETRATMDIDTTVKALSLNPDRTRVIVEEILAVEINDGVHFSISKESSIMEEHDYPGLRYILNATLERMREIIRIDISTGDIITPAAIEYSYKLMFEDRRISLWTYNLETVLSEKIETMMARGTANTRMRDFYDVFVLYRQEKDTLNVRNLIAAFNATSAKRNTSSLIPDLELILLEVSESSEMQKSWGSYKSNNYYVESLSWNDVMQTVMELARLLMSKN